MSRQALLLRATGPLCAVSLLQVLYRRMYTHRPMFKGCSMERCSSELEQNGVTFATDSTPGLLLPAWAESQVFVTSPVWQSAHVTLAWSALAEADTPLVSVKVQLPF